MLSVAVPTADATGNGSDPHAGAKPSRRSHDTPASSAPMRHVPRNDLAVPRQLESPCLTIRHRARGEQHRRNERRLLLAIAHGLRSYPEAWARGCAARAATVSWTRAPRNEWASERAVRTRATERGSALVPPTDPGGRAAGIATSIATNDDKPCESFLPDPADRRDAAGKTLAPGGAVVTSKHQQPRR